jgi:tripartite-type tricarboxylate transporter receptor subunit TctC
MIVRRNFLRIGAAAAAIPAPLAAPAIAQAPWPNKPIKIVCTYPPGGLTDIFSRAYGDFIAQKTGQTVVVENKTGAAGAIGAELVAKSPADGYTLMFTNSTTMVQNKVLFKKLPYDPDKDFVLVSWHDTGHLPTVVHKDVPVNNMAELAQWAKGRKVSFATYGIGSYAHVVIETLNRHHGYNIEAVHYRGEGAMWPDVSSGTVQGASGSYASSLPTLQTGNARMIAVPTLKRMKKMPNVATFYEQGLKDMAFQVRGWVGCCAPAGTSPEIQQKLSAMMVEGGKTERVQKILDQFGIDGAAEDATYFRKVLDEEGPVVLDIIRSFNIEPT